MNAAGKVSETKIPDDLKELHKHSYALALMIYRECVENEELSDGARLDVEHQFSSACADYTKQSHRTDDFAPSTVWKLIKRIATAESNLRHGEAHEKELREEIERLNKLLDYRVSDMTTCMRQSGALKDENTSLRAEVERLKTEVCSECGSPCTDKDLVGNQIELGFPKYWCGFCINRHLAEDEVKKLRTQLAEMQRPVSDEQGERSFTVWNGWIKGALRWRELEPYEQNRWKAAIGAARAAKGGE